MINNKKIYVVSGFIALVVALVVGLGLATHTSPTSVSNGSLGAISGPVHNTPENFTQGIGIGGGNLVFSANGIIPLGSNQAFWRNTTGRTVYVTQVTVATSGFASSTSKIYAYATTSAPSLIYNFTAPVANATTTLFINGFALATSSAATTTSNLDKTVAGRMIAIPDQSYVDIIQIQDTSATGCASASGSCESATSTNRGFTLPWNITGFYRP